MHEKEIAELRRHLRPDRVSPGALYGCLVNEKKEIVTAFRQPLSVTSQDDLGALLTTMRKVLSGTPDKNLLTLPFTNSQVMDSDVHRLFMDLRDPTPRGAEAVNALFGKIAETAVMDGPYMILLLQDVYDVPAYAKDGEKEESESVFSYALTALCPLKETKPALGFLPGENAFKSLSSQNVIAPPAVGFLFPSFDDRTANIYDVLYYTKDTSSNHPEFIESVLEMTVPMPADEQKETFSDLLSASLDTDCSLKVALNLTDAFREQLEDYKTSGEEEARPVVTKSKVSALLRESGVAEERVAAFSEKYEEQFGKAALPPQNLLGSRQIEVDTPDVQIRVNPDRSDLIGTRTIDGVRYILIRAENGVEVNGMRVNLE